MWLAMERSVKKVLVEGKGFIHFQNPVLSPRITLSAFRRTIAIDFNSRHASVLPSNP
jgi:hypothetical protein